MELLNLVVHIQLLKFHLYKNSIYFLSAFAMENLTNTPGLQHIAEEIFFNLDNESLANCVKVNRLWKNILNPLFWMEKCTKEVALCMIFTILLTL